MNARKLAELRETWGDRPCEHPEVQGVGHSGLEACSQCGRIIDRDTQGRPVPRMSQP